MISFNQIQKTPTHYCHELIMENEPSFLFYQYGSYLVKNHTNYFTSQLRFVKHDYLQLLIQVTRMMNTINPNITYKDAKQTICDIMKESCKFQFFHHIYKIGSNLLDQINMIKRKDKSLESAMLNYAPIVPYGPNTLKYPELLVNYNEMFNPPPSFNKLDEKIKHMFLDHICEIIKHDTSFVNIDNMGDSPDGLYLPNELLNLNKTDYGMYFILVFLRYVTPVDQFQNVCESIFKINIWCNKISNGEKIDIQKATETFSIISPI